MTAQDRRVFIKTYGCQMNVYDSGRMVDALAPSGFSETDDIESADLVLLNTCHIREKAVDKVYSDLGRIREAQQRRAAGGERMMVGVTGCVAQAEGKEILRREAAVDLVVGPQSYHRLPQLVAEAERHGRLVETDFPAEDKFDYIAPPERAILAGRGPAAFLTVQEGCDKFCAFCVVPYTRGAEVSRPASRILAEARRMVEAGIAEITLLGQNVNAYHGAGADGRDWTLGRLLFALADIPGLKRLRYTTSHPLDMHDELYAAHRDLQQLMPYLHLPVQSGSDRMLAAMNRRHTRAEYLAVIDRVRRARPDIAFSSDFIVGFPGEEAADFEASLSLIREVGYTQCFSFKYSPRPGTPAVAIAEQVPEAVKSERLSRLQELLDEGARNFARSLVGSEMEVLLEKPGRHPGQWVGRSPFLQPVNVMAPGTLKGRVVLVRITDTGRNSLFGELSARPTGVHAELQPTSQEAHL